MSEKTLRGINYMVEVVICHDYGDMAMVMIAIMNGYIDEDDDMSMVIMGGMAMML